MVTLVRNDDKGRVVQYDYASERTEALTLLRMGIPSPITGCTPEIDLPPVGPDDAKCACQVQAGYMGLRARS